MLQPIQSPNVKIELLNAQSLTNKSCLIHDHFLDKHVDLMCLTETWHKPDVFSVLDETCPPGYHYLQKANSTGRGPAFILEMYNLLSSFCSTSANTFILGDMNIYLKTPSCCLAAEFLQFLDCFNLTQHVDVPTHTRGHTLPLSAIYWCMTWSCLTTRSSPWNYYFRPPTLRKNTNSALGIRKTSTQII